MEPLVLTHGVKTLCLQPDTGLLTLSQNGTVFWEQSAGRLVFASCGRPWQSETRLRMTEYTFRDEALHCVFADDRFRVSVTFSFLPEGYLRADLSLRNISGGILKQAACGLMLETAAPSAQKVTIPHVIYNDNPSADPTQIVPHIGKEPGKGTIVEEHRLPIPGVNLEWKAENESRYLTLLSIPHVTSGEDADYWSLGALYGKSGHTIAALSGPLMFGGLKDMVYGGQCTPLPYERGYRVLPIGETLEKSFILDFGTVPEGRGFRKLVELGFQMLKPHNRPSHSFRQMVEYKKMVLDSRYSETGDSRGYLCFGAANTFGNLSNRPEYYLYAWTGQALKLAWSECKIGLDDDSSRLKRTLGTVEFFVNGAEGAVPGLLRCYYMLKEKSWRGSWNEENAPLSSRMEGEALIDLIDILSLLKAHGRQAPAAWEALVQRCCSFLSGPEHWTETGLFPGAWTVSGEAASQMVNTAGVPCILALVKASEYFHCPAYLETARQLFRRYYDVHMRTFDLPFARSTMDAKCEDKEAGIYMFCSAAELYRVTCDTFYREAADTAADWLLTFVYFWETGFRPGSLCHEKGFTTTGWPGVSVQNHHLDVFFPSWEMYDYGKLTGNQRLMHMGRTVAQALTYGVCTVPGEWGYSVVGEQGEQYYQTNYFQLRYPAVLAHLERWRGGMQCWNPSWITAQVLQASLRFLEEE